ncbi:MAG TPA: (d)CMP kinase [Polyangiaceae bacterium]
MSTTNRPRPIVAIDGPAGAGKSTVARRLADTLGFVFVDTGALYRTVAVAAKRAGVAWDDARSVGELANALVARGAIAFDRDAERGVRVWLDEKDVTDAIREPDIGMGASTVSAHKAVRDALLDLQRHAGRAGGVVLEGRDIGTVVFPDAEVKFFLTARPEVRAKRRFDELTAKGQRVTLEDTLVEVRRRDEQDTTRPVAPLKQAEDAVLIDNSDFGVDETVARMADRVRQRSG